MHFNVTIVSVKENGYRNYFWYISKDKAINIMKHFDLSQKTDHCKNMKNRERLEEQTRNKY